MLSLPPSIRIFLCLPPTDMRRSFDTLALMVEQVLDQDPLSGHLFVFCNRRRDRVKLLYWDGDGYALWYKRLEQGVFRMPQPAGAGQHSLSVSSAQLMMWLDGIDFTRVKHARRYERRSA
jgi:transposase